MSRAIRGNRLTNTGTLAALGTNQATAAPVVTDVANVTGANGTVGVVLGAPLAAQLCLIYNAGSGALNVYPPVGGTINGGSANAGIVLPALSAALFVGTSGTNWSSTAVGTGGPLTVAALTATGNATLNGSVLNVGASTLLYPSIVNAAAAGSVIANAGALAGAATYRVTAADGTKGVQLPVGQVGMEVSVVNTVNAVLKVYPQVNGSINNSSAANASVSLAGFKGAVYTCVAVAPDEWWSLGN